ncbi:MAG: hypothetical protein ABR520_02210 [Mycobacteriales bacterium]|nr:hypothetical protein [Frankia sp.]
MRRQAVLGAVALAFAIAPAAAQTPQPTQGIGLRPLPGSNYLSKSGSFFELGSVAPGRSVVLLLEARNVDPEPHAVRLFGADAEPSRGGGFAFAQRTAAQRDVGAWLRVAPTTLRLAGTARATVRATVTVPVNATPGEHVGGVLAEPLEPARPGIRVQTRVAVALYLTTGGTARPAVTIDKVRLRHTDHTTCAEVVYRNTGNTVVDPEVTAEYDGWLAKRRVVTQRHAGGVRPGDTLSVRLPCFPKTPPGPGKVKVTIRYPGGQQTEDVATGRYPWWLWLVIAVPLALLLLLLLWRRRRRDRDALRALFADADELTVRLLAAAQAQHHDAITALEAELRELANRGAHEPGVRAAHRESFRAGVTDLAAAAAGALAGESTVVRAQTDASATALDLLRKSAGVERRPRDWSALIALAEAPRRSPRGARRPRKD